MAGHCALCCYICIILASAVCSQLLCWKTGKTETAKLVMQYLAHRALPLHTRPQRRKAKEGVGSIKENSLYSTAEADVIPIEEQVRP